MTITEKINSDLKEAILNQDKIKINTLRLLKTVLKIEKNDNALTLEEEKSRLFKAAKQRKDSAQTFIDGNRKDLADIELNELSIIEGYLPKQLNELEITDIIKETIKEVNATSMKDIGSVMKALMPKVKGIADGSIVQRVVKSELS